MMHFMLLDLPVFLFSSAKKSLTSQQNKKPLDLFQIRVTAEGNKAKSPLNFKQNSQTQQIIFPPPPALMNGQQKLILW